MIGFAIGVLTGIIIGNCLNVWMNNNDIVNAAMNPDPVYESRGKKYYIISKADAEKRKSEIYKGGK